MKKKKKYSSDSFNVLIADGQEILRRGLRDLMLSCWPNAKVFVAHNLSEALVKNKQTINLIIFDLCLEGESNQKLINQIKIVHPDVKILIFSSLNEEIYALPLIKCGAHGFLPKKAEESEIVTAVSAILAGGKYLSRLVKENVINKVLDNKPDNPHVVLSNRELEIAGFLKQGLGVLEISRRLNLQMGTISTYKIRIFNKLNIKNVIELAEKINNSY
ncbi:response regulator [Pedobacter sp. GSP4]|uniref:response regulator n=1 Tax=Pedobacter sp. GSP4 TaxID=3453716 RepID=UPI003EEEF75B